MSDEMKRELNGVKTRLGRVETKLGNIETMFQRTMVTIIIGSTTTTSA